MSERSEDRSVNCFRTASIGDNSQLQLLQQQQQNIPTSRYQHQHQHKQIHTHSFLKNVFQFYFRMPRMLKTYICAYKYPISPRQ